MIGLTADEPQQRAAAITSLANFDDPNAVAALTSAIKDPNTDLRQLAAKSLLQQHSNLAPTFLCQYLRSEDVALRNLAAKTLAAFGTESLPALQKACSDPDQVVRKFAVEVIGLIGHASAVPTLLQRLHDQSENVVRSAIEALGLIADPVSVVDLLSGYDLYPFARPQIIAALGRIGDQQALPLLARALKSDDSALVNAAVEAMGNLESPGVAMYLRELLEGADQTLEEAIIGAMLKLARSCNRSVLESLPWPQLKKLIENAIRSNNPQTKRLAFDELASWRSPEATKMVIDLLLDPNEETAEYAPQYLNAASSTITDEIASALHSANPAAACRLLEAIAGTGNAQFVPQVAPLIRHADASVRERAAMALGRIGGREVDRTLLPLVTDSMPGVRAAALKAIGWVGASEVVDSVVAALDDPLPEVQQAALGALILSGGRRAITQFREDLSHPQARRQVLAAQALGWIGEKEVVGPLLTALNHSEADVRRAAVESLGRVGDAGLMHRLQAALADGEPTVRRAAIDSIIGLGGSALWKEIACMLDDPDVWVRYHAINVIGRTGKREALELLLPFLTCAHDVLRVAAAQALAHLHDKRALPFLKGSARDKNPDVVGAVAQAINQLEAL